MYFYSTQFQYYTTPLNSDTNKKATLIELNLYLKYETRKYKIFWLVSVTEAEQFFTKVPSPFLGFVSSTFYQSNASRRVPEKFSSFAGLRNGLPSPIPCAI